LKGAATALTLAEDRNSLTIPPTGSPVLPILTGTGKTHIAAPLAPPPLKHKSGSYCHFTLQVTAAGGHFMVPPSGHFMGSVTQPVAVEVLDGGVLENGSR